MGQNLAIKLEPMGLSEIHINFISKWLGGLQGLGLKGNYRSGGSFHLFIFHFSFENHGFVLKFELI
jgi:hypothetical protein